MAYRMRMGDSVSDLVANAWTGKLTTNQRDRIVDDCAQQVVKAGGGRLTLAQAQAQCSKDIDASIKLNGGTSSLNLPSAAKAGLGIGILAAAALTFGVVYVAVRAAR